MDGAVLAASFGAVQLAAVPQNEWSEIASSNMLGARLPDRPIFVGEHFDVSFVARSLDPTASRARIDGFRFVLQWSPAEALEVVGKTPTSWVTYSYNEESAGQLGVVGGSIAPGLEASTQGEEVSLLPPLHACSARNN